MYLSLQDGWSPLMEAASTGYAKSLQLLLDKGADVNQQSKVSLFHHEMRSLPLVHVYHVPLYEWSISSKVSLISPSTFACSGKTITCFEKPYLCNRNHFYVSLCHVQVPFYFQAY